VEVLLLLKGFAAFQV